MLKPFLGVSETSAQMLDRSRVLRNRLGLKRVSKTNTSSCACVFTVGTRSDAEEFLADNSACSGRVDL